MHTSCCRLLLYLAPPAVTKQVPTYSFLVREHACAVQAWCYLKSPFAGMKRALSTDFTDDLLSEIQESSRVAGASIYKFIKSNRLCACTNVAAVSIPPSKMEAALVQEDAVSKDCSPGNKANQTALISNIAVLIVLW